MIEVGVSAGLGGGDDEVGRGRGIAGEGPGDPDVVAGGDVAEGRGGLDSSPGTGLALV